MFESFHKFLPRAANVYGISREVKAAQVCHNFRELVPEMFPGITENLRPHRSVQAADAANLQSVSPELPISPAHFKDGILTINVESPAWAQEVLMRKSQILSALNRKAELVIVKNLRTRINSEGLAP